MGQLEFGANPAHGPTIAGIVRDAYADFKVGEALKDFQRHSGNLPAFRELRV
jgi:hypothetical protein